MKEKEIHTRFSKLYELTKANRGINQITGISESRSAAIAGLIAGARGGQTLVITSSYGRAKRLAEDLPLFVAQTVYLLPDEDQAHLNYEAKSHDGLIARLSALTALAKGEECIVVAPVMGAAKKILPKDTFARYAFRLAIGEEALLEDLRHKLVCMGYERAVFVESKGQFSIRGGILDVYPPDQERPLRVEFFDTEIDSIRTYDPISQRSHDKKQKVLIYPAQQIVLEEDAFHAASQRIKKDYERQAHKLEEAARTRLLSRMEHLLEYIREGMNIQYLENYIQYFYESPHALWDYLQPSGGIIVDDPDRVTEAFTLAAKEAEEDFKARLESGLAVPHDHHTTPTEKELFHAEETRATFLLTPFQKQIKGVDRLDALIAIPSKQAPVFNGRMDFLETELQRYVKLQYEIVLYCATSDRVNNLHDFLCRVNLEEKVQVKEGVLSCGMEFPGEKLLWFSDKDIFATTKYKKSKKEGGERKAVKAFTEIRKGDYVVHDNHGIGKFVETVQMEVQGVRRDYLKIKYAGEDWLYIPVDQMDLIQKFSSSDGVEPKISKLGGSEWKKTKERVKAAIRDMTKELLTLTAERQLQQGFAFSQDTVWQNEFEDRFPYEETPDQLRCIKEIKKDMERPVAMDRLLCGDVGYGKTEVAARAVFKCVAEGRQAAILVPTTLLANQHYYTFRERFEAFPMKVEMLSRFRTAKQQEDIAEKAERGEIDILIGTHRILSQDLHFKDLGLLVVDEEQHFGVQHKEKIKSMKKNVDVLTLSATPIPRTLHMSLIGIRDISLLEDPPEERYPVQTYVTEQDDFMIKEAIERELDRNGQVYLVYNRVKGIHKIASHIQELVPQAEVIAAHGQMDEKQLEDIMLKFVEGECNVLVSTTIIESGIDISNANTMIILDADRFGLSQLYQLRGRVGRSNRMAYAYLMYQRDKVLTEVAEKRLRAIREFTEFGSGFQIAMRDLEIRGAGNLLGAEQHGHLMTIGYELYCKLVEEAVQELSGNVEFRFEEDIPVELGVEGYLPSEYIEDELMKLTMYKKIASIREEVDAEEVIEELIDRFGDLPKVAYNLVSVARIKALARKAHIGEVKKEKSKLMFYFSMQKGPDREKLAAVAAEYGVLLLLHGGQRPYASLSLQKKEILSECVAFLTKLIP